MNYEKEVYYLCDQITEQIITIGIGEVWLYFYKETLIGVRDVRNKVSYFLDPDTKNDTKTTMAPTLANLTEESIREAIEEHDLSSEKTHRVHLQELFDHTTRLILGELHVLIKQSILG